MDLDVMLKALGKAIASERELRRWKQADLAERAGVSERQVGKIERGERGQIAEVLKIAEALGVDFSVLVAEAEAKASRIA